MSNTTINVTDLVAKTTYHFTLVDGTEFDAMYTSTTSKGLTLKDGDRVFTRALSKVASVTTDIFTVVDTAADLFHDGEAYGAAAIAATLEMSAYDLRVLLRDMGLGVGKGHKYGFDAGDARNIYRAVRSQLVTPVPEA